RSDLKAQREMVQSQAASNAISVQNLLPQFDITGIIGLQGVGTDFGRSFNRSFSNPELGVAVIMQLNIPLSPYKMSNIRRAYKSNTHSAKLNFERQKFEQDQEWKRLTTRLEENLQLLGFLYKNEEVQKAKFENAESEYSRGLNTVFVVTGAQNDYQSSKIVILQTFQTLIEILLNLSLYSAD
ncbi:MAG: hypothetical protein FJZ64_00145, partial [Chlamydiae bacterium]|nr:hypothetical protein [Chlamydiota bacterium]